MSLKTRFDRLPFFWKVYITVVILLIFVVSLVEVFLEPAAMIILEKMYGGFEPWHEVILWAVSLLGPSLAGGYVLSIMLASRLEKMSRAAKALAKGNMQVRIPVENKENDPLDVLARSFNEMAAEIERQINDERRLLVDISHELRSPLARMAIATELLSRRQGQDERKELAMRMGKEVEQMSELVSLLLAQAKDKILLSDVSQIVDMSALTREAADDFSFQGTAQGKPVKADIQPGLFIQGNTVLLQRILGNILSNALFYGPPRQPIEVRARLSGEEVVVCIRDYGPGVPEDQLESIFRAFHRVDDSRTRGSGGVGLGLGLVKESVALHGGNVKAENVSPGLKVTVSFPYYGPLLGGNMQPEQSPGCPPAPLKAR